ncbi:hypothetical protein [Priestia sp. AB]|uniref:hypothetical protein n=1 Tax=Priestia sp. AB TaxID=3020890 RepID=UPI00232C01D7|nr:hypothetical protein [Priestia sp. AB]MDC0706698.1 hypothetical protein [Priestia sp. AB]MED4212950.1 hypothetical protein [Priestia megaterium]
MQYVFTKEAPSRKSFISTIIILLGSVLASGFLQKGIIFSFAGISWGMLAAVSFALFIYISGNTTIPVHPIYKSAIMTTGASLLIFISLPPVFLINDALTDGLFMYGLLTGFFGSLVLHATVTFLQWIGVIIILGGIAYPNVQIHKNTRLIKKNV